MKNFLSFVIFVSVGFAVRAAPSLNSLKPEALGAKALLEDLLVKRYSQELAVLVKKETFNLGATLELTEVAKVSPNATIADEPISGLMLGKLDPEALLNKYGSGESLAQSFLNNYKIKTVAVSIGLNDNLGPEVKADVEKWLKLRLSSEFGKNGKGAVSFIKIPLNTETKTFWDWLSQFQTLAGQFVLGFLALLAVLVWKVIGKPISVNINGPTDLPTLTAQLNGKNEVSGNLTGGGTAQAAGSTERTQNEQAVTNLTHRLNELALKVSHDMESIVRSWCQQGDPGKLRLACFAEAVGKEIGKLPIPVDAVSDITRLFAKMSNLDPAEKKEALQKAYWDILAVINLGPEALEQPFGYLGGINIGMMKEMLMDQNPKMQTLVSIHLPVDVRAQYIKTLTAESKVAMLTSAVKLNEIPIDELKTLDNTLKQKFKPQAPAGSIPLELSLKKLFDALTPIEQLTLLPLVQEPAMLDFKRKTATLAFINEWPDDAIKRLVDGSSADHLVAFLKVRPELSERLLNLCPPLTAELVKDELTSLKTLTEKELNLKIKFFALHLEVMVKSKQISMEEIFANTQKIFLNKNTIKAA